VGHWRCLECGIKTGTPEKHDELIAKYSIPHTPNWEHCSCGSGPHPRRCELHPNVYDFHCAELNKDYELDELREKMKEIHILVKRLSHGETCFANFKGEKGCLCPLKDLQKLLQGE
jgi:hypothetical protein